MQMSRRAYDESVFTMTNKFSSFLGAALKKLSQYLGDAEEVIHGMLWLMSELYFNKLIHGYTQKFLLH